MLFNSEDRLVTCNSAYREVYSTTADQIRPGVRFEELLRLGLERGQHRVPEGEREDWLETRLAQHKAPSGPLEQVIDSGRWLRFEERRTADGGVVGIRTDITELKQREEAFARQTALLETTLQNMGEAIAAFDRDRKLVVWNGNCHRMFGAPAELFHSGQSFDAIVRYHADRGGFGPRDPEDAFRRMVEDFHVRVPTSRIVRRHQGRAIEARRRPTPDGGAVYVFRDVSEREEYERRLGEAVLAAEAANKAKSEFLAMMSHEIRTPMNAIIGMSSVLAERELGATEKRYVHVIAEAGEKLLIIIDDLLDLSRLEAGKLKLSESSFDIRDVVASAVEMANTLPQARSLSIIKEIDADAPPSLVADADRINQIILNLVNNAVKYAQRGTVTIRVSCTSQDASTVRLRCVVEDTGPGIPEEVQARLFEPFQRGQVDKQIPGAGLGLSICRRLVEAMGGSIGVRSEIGVGTSFFFEIPCKTPPRASAPAPRERTSANPPAKGSRRLRLLVAEDVAANQTVIAAMLSSLGHDADLVRDGAPAVSAALTTDYDAILMDLQMPEVNGFDAIRAIREQGGTRGAVPIIALTAYAYQDDREAATLAGASGYLTKPIRKAELAAALQAIAEKAQDEPGDPSFEPRFDKSIVDEMREEMGNETFARLIAQCAKDVRFRMDQLQSPRCSGSQAARAVAHQLRGLLPNSEPSGQRVWQRRQRLATKANLPDDLAMLKQSAAEVLASFQLIGES